MFKKLKDKLAEEVKSSPQRIQQFAQAAQAAVTSASSSISDITNSDLFSIGDNDAQNTPATKLSHSLNKQPNTYQDSSLGQITMDPIEYPGREESQRQRKLSNSSFASDISFRLPSYETPSMYHLQSDMEVSASEAEERGFSGSNVSLERVTKEQLYAAYRRTQERYTKYRTQYGDLARHYKLLEKENAKARSVLVETQDKALRRISELREQCALEQSAKAHLEQSLRVEIEDKNTKIDALNSEIQALKNNTNTENLHHIQMDKRPNESESELQLINFSNENEPKINEMSITEVTSLNIKIEKMEQLLNKYKESLKTSKDKNTQVINDLQILSNELENKNKEIDNLTATVQKLNEENKIIHELNSKNEELENKINAYDFAKSKEVSALEIDLQRAKDEIEELQNKIIVFTKREEDYAISLAENKLSIHKELENKESEIKSLKDGLSAAKKEIQSLNIVIDECKSSLTTVEEEKTKFNNAIKELKLAKSKITDLESILQETTKKLSQLENTKSKLDEDYKCLQLQLKQETAEKLAMIDRNVYLENRNMQISEENTKKSAQISSLENELINLNKDKSSESSVIANEKNEILTELNIWKSKYETLESEIQDERVELVKLQSEIEKLLVNHELIQSQNTDFRNIISDLKTENITLQEQVLHCNQMKNNYKKLLTQVNEIQQLIKLSSDQVTLLQRSNCDGFVLFEQQIKEALNQFTNREIKHTTIKQNELSSLNKSLQNEITNASEENAVLLNKINKIQEENDIFKSKNQNYELQITNLNEKLCSLSKQYEEAIQNLEGIELEKENLNCTIKEEKSKSNNLQVSLELEQAKQLDLIDQINLLENEKKILLQKNTSIEETNLTLKSQLEKIRDDCNSEIEEIVNSKNILNKDLVEKTDELNGKMILINQLQEKIKVLTEENITLEIQAQNIARNVKDLESEMNDVRVSHAAIVVEKDRLSGIIEILEKKGNEHETKGTQTEIAIENTIIPSEIATLEASEQNYILKNQIEITDNMYKEDEFCKKCASQKTDHDILKAENRRLHSDIEGLQTYLTKISKENCILNDKLRELIATSEHTVENDMINNMTDLKGEIEMGKEKIEDLTRENMLLVEENLELKDQLQAQNYTIPMDGTKTYNENENKDNMVEKYNNLLQVNNELEERLREYEHMNKSVNTNVQQMQEKNDKLKSSNDKLERRLDEALVSLRHLHSLQENTELEYLRNILYEYLTGSGTHSVTLAKVLSAIVKFDDSQTQLVLQKEKERQGFLRQLGLI